MLIEKENNRLKKLQLFYVFKKIKKFFSLKDDVQGKLNCTTLGISTFMNRFPKITINRVHQSLVADGLNRRTIVKK